MNDEKPKSATSRRTLLKLSAVAAPMVVTLKPAYAQAGMSPLCETSLTLEDTEGRWIDKNTGDLVPSGRGAIPPLESGPDGVYNREEIRAAYGLPHDPSAVQSRTLSTNAPASSTDRQAHMKALRRMTSGDGYSCYFSAMGGNPPPA